jgi:Rrf2 family iron-sulfur cluster assembly transcriptional regulator
MKFSTQEEYGLRLLLRIAKSDSPNGFTIPELSEVEGLSAANTAKILRALSIAQEDKQVDTS